MKILKLGNSLNPANHIKIEDKTVSYEHLEIMCLDNGQIKLKNLSNTNQTKVNDFVIRESDLIQATDKIIIGQAAYTGQELLDKVNAYLNKDKFTFYSEFLQLEPIFTEYNTEIKKIKTKHKNNVAMVRFGVPFLLIVLFVFFGKTLGISPEIRIIIPLIGGSAAALLAEKFFDTEKLKDNLKDVEIKYATKLRCPKCSHSLLREPYRYWKNERKCPRCQSKWVE